METDDLRKLAEIEGWVWREATLAWYDGDRPVARATLAGIDIHDGAAFGLIEKYDLMILPRTEGGERWVYAEHAAGRDPDLRMAIVKAVVAAHE